ncbi:hypothetical protein ANANG_G00131190 [Anguilla anguilla]|uniref:Uncharacterized protein n=1 Tax=Anguilla anguilla TaxID=7936 RepID=A0A9D3MFB2_ANGAN|nr:hypothetical protein ANANG_G00131190 [Anguilla anguilla]
MGLVLCAHCYSRGDVGKEGLLLPPPITARQYSASPTASETPHRTTPKPAERVSRSPAGSVGEGITSLPVRIPLSTVHPCKLPVSIPLASVVLPSRAERLRSTPSPVSHDKLNGHMNGRQPHTPTSGTAIVNGASRCGTEGGKHRRRKRRSSGLPPTEGGSSKKRAVPGLGGHPSASPLDMGSMVSNISQPLEIEAISSPEPSTPGGPRGPHHGHDLDQPPVLKRERPLEVNGRGRDSSPASSDSAGPRDRPAHGTPRPVLPPERLFPSDNRDGLSAANQKGGASLGRKSSGLMGNEVLASSSSSSSGKWKSTFSPITDPKQPPPDLRRGASPFGGGGRRGGGDSDSDDGPRRRRGAESGRSLRLTLRDPPSSNAAPSSRPRTRGPEPQNPRGRGGNGGQNPFGAAAPRQERGSLCAVGRALPGRAAPSCGGFCPSASFRGQTARPRREPREW